MTNETAREAASESNDDLLSACKGISGALREQNVGAIAEKHGELILRYYRDVQTQANQSFETACSSARWGFFVLIATLVVVVGLDTASHIPSLNFKMSDFKAVTLVGLVSGTLIEGISAIAFVLYARGASQFGAFHICLERTYRYLLAYKIAEQSGPRKEDTLRDLVCIMATAPMVTGADIDSDLPLPQKPESKTQTQTP